MPILQRQYYLYTITVLYLICPYVLSTVEETSYVIRVGFIESDIVFTYLLTYSMEQSPS